MLQNFRFTQYRFAYTVQEPLKMPEYKGNVFRGRLGYILRRTTCVGGAGQCEEACEFPERCVYSRCFETQSQTTVPFSEANRMRHIRLSSNRRTQGN